MGEGKEAAIFLDLMYRISLNVPKAEQVGGSSIGHVNRLGLFLIRMDIWMRTKGPGFVCWLGDDGIHIFKKFFFF